MRFKIDWASLIFGINLPFLLCFTLYLSAIFHGVRLKNFYSSNLLCICPSSLETNLNKPKYNICKKLSSVFSVAGSRCHHIRTGSLPLGDKDDEKYDNRLILLIILKANCPCECDAKLKSLNKLPRRRVSLQVKNRWLEELEMVALFLLQTGTFSAKNW